MNEDITTVRFGRNYFKVLDLRQKFDLSEAEINRKFLKRQQIITEYKDEPSINMEYALLNQAYNVICDPMSRANHIFEIYDIHRIMNNIDCVNLERLVLNESKEDKRAQFDIYFSNMRECFRQKDLIGAYQAWCSCSFLQTLLRAGDDTNDSIT